VIKRLAKTKGLRPLHRRKDDGPGRRVARSGVVLVLIYTIAVSLASAQDISVDGVIVHSDGALRGLSDVWVSLHFDDETYATETNEEGAFTIVVPTDVWVADSANLVWRWRDRRGSREIQKQDSSSLIEFAGVDLGSTQDETVEQQFGRGPVRPSESRRNRETVGAAEEMAGSAGVTITLWGVQITLPYWLLLLLPAAAVILGIFAVGERLYEWYQNKKREFKEEIVTEAVEQAKFEIKPVAMDVQKDYIREWVAKEFQKLKEQPRQEEKDQSKSAGREPKVVYPESRQRAVNRRNLDPRQEIVDGYNRARKDDTHRQRFNEQYTTVRVGVENHEDRNRSVHAGNKPIFRAMSKGNYVAVPKSPGSPECWMFPVFQGEIDTFVFTGAGFEDVFLCEGFDHAKKYQKVTVLEAAEFRKKADGMYELVEGKRGRLRFEED